MTKNVCRVEIVCASPERARPISLHISYYFFSLSIRFACSKPLLWERCSTVKSFFASSDWRLAPRIDTFSRRKSVVAVVTPPRDMVIFFFSICSGPTLRVKINENDFSCTNFHAGVSLNVRPSTRSLREITNFSGLWTAIAAEATANIYTQYATANYYYSSVLCRGRRWLWRGHMRTIRYCFGRVKQKE